MRAICQICGEFYAEVSIDGVDSGDGKPGIEALRYPVTGAMFGSSDPFHGVPAPFDPSLEWEFMRCPFGRTHRPFVQDDIVLTHKGMVRLPKDGSQAFIDPNAPTEIGRESIGDRVMAISDEEAERLVRSEIKKIGDDKIPWVESGVAGTIENAVLLETHAYEMFICPHCSKSFDKKNQLTGHMISHKRG